MEGQEEATSIFRLPPEIRYDIWELILPRGRVLRIAFKGHDKVNEYARSICPIAIPIILHICSESRQFARTSLRLGFGRESTKDDQDWWNPSRDILYLPPWQPPANWDLRVSFKFHDFEENFPNPPLDINYDDSNVGSPTHHQSLAYVQHLALPFNFKVLNGIKFSERNESWLPKWLHNFPSLKSVTLLIDHVPQWYRAGDIQLYMPLDAPLNGPLPTASLACNMPSSVEMKIAQKLEEFTRFFDLDWKIPSVKIMVVRNTETKEQCEFCLPFRLD